MTRRKRPAAPRRLDGRTATAEQVTALLQPHTPQARLQRHREAWGVNPPAHVADALENAQRVLDAGGDSGKVTLWLRELDLWDKDRRLTRGKGKGGRETAKTNAEDADARMEVALKSRERVLADDWPERNVATEVAARTGYSVSAVRRYFRKARALGRI